MKKFNFLFLIVCALSFLFTVMTETQAQAPTYTYTAWRETDLLPNGQPQPLDFMTLGDQNHKYVQCRYGDDFDNPSQTYGYTGSGNNRSHELIQTSANDPCRCYYGQTSPGHMGYIHENVLPPSWDGVLGNTQDKVIRVGCYGCHYCQCTQSQQIEYWFYPPKDSSTLLVYFTFAQENVYYHNASYNPRFYIEVYDGQTNQLIQTQNGYYKRCDGTTNNQWPYNRFLAVPSGCDSMQNTHCPDPTGVLPNGTYYWAFPQATPTTFDYRRCPKNQTSGFAQYEVTWFEYKPLAFDLKSYADQNKSVKLRISVNACGAGAHWAYGMFAAKLMPGYITVDACGSDVVTLTVPWGFLENTYEWHYGADPDNADNRILSINDPDQPGVTGRVYEVHLDPSAGARIYPYYRCEMKSYTGAPFIYEAYVTKYEIEPSFRYEQIVDPDHPCSHVIELHNTGRVCELTPKANGLDYDTTEQTPLRVIDWYYKNSNGVYQRIPGSSGDTVVRFNVSTTADIDLSNFDYSSDSIMIKLVMQDSLKKCIDSIEMNIGLDSSFVKVGTSETSVFACNDQLPYFYDRDKYGDTYRWDGPGTKECHVGEDFGDKSWNGCDSVVVVKLEVMNPKIEIKDLGDYCDSFRTTLTVVPAPGQPFEQEDIEVLDWNGDETSAGLRYLAEHAGVYTASASIGESGCKTSTSYKIAACMPFMNLPNTITPSNRDNINDCFEIPQKSLVKSLEFTVYNRNGAVVFHTTDVNFRWRGARFSEDYPDMEFCNQTYVYTLKLVDYNGKPYPVIKGSILVL